MDESSNVVPCSRPALGRSRHEGETGRKRTLCVCVCVRVSVRVCETTAAATAGRLVDDGIGPCHAAHLVHESMAWKRKQETRRWRVLENTGARGRRGLDYAEKRKRLTHQSASPAATFARCHVEHGPGNAQLLSRCGRSVCSVYDRDREIVSVAHHHIRPRVSHGGPAAVVPWCRRGSACGRGRGRGISRPRAAPEPPHKLTPRVQTGALPHRQAHVVPSPLGKERERERKDQFPPAG